MSRFKIIDHKSSLQEIVNPIAVYARQLRDRALAVDTETTGPAGIFWPALGAVAGYWAALIEGDKE